MVRAAGAGAESGAYHDAARWQVRWSGAGIRTGYVGAAAALPDEVRAAVRQDITDRRLPGRRDSHPQAGQRVAQRRRRQPLAVSRLPAATGRVHLPSLGLPQSGGPMADSFKTAGARG